MSPAIFREGTVKDHCYCPTFARDEKHGLHPKCKECRYFKEVTE